MSSPIHKTFQNEIGALCEKGNCSKQKSKNSDSSVISEARSLTKKENLATFILQEDSKTPVSQFSTPLKLNNEENYCTRESRTYNIQDETASRGDSIDERLNDTIVSGSSAARPLLTAVQNSLNGGKTDWCSIYVASFLTFCCSVQYGLYINSMWPFLEIIDETANESFFGYIVSAYALGQIFGSPIIGFLSNRCKRVAPLIYCCLLLMFFGNTLYFAVELVQPPQNRKYLIMFAQFITGCGSSNICILKIYASTASSFKDRSRAIAFITGGISLGMMIGPAFQLVFTQLNYPGFQIGVFNVSMYTAPAMMACVILLLNAATVHFFFRENYAGLINSQKKPKLNKDKSNKLKFQSLPNITGSLKLTKNKKKEPEHTFVLAKYDRCAIALCHLTRFTQMFANVNMDTIGASIAEIFFAWNATEVVKALSISHVFISLIAFLIYLSFIFFKFDKLINFRMSCVLSLVILIASYALTFSYPFLPQKIQTFNHTALAAQPSVARLSYEHPLGCDVEKFLWCEWVRVPNPIFFFAAHIICIGIAFSNLNIALNTLFSKIIGPRKQGTQQGILQMSGGIARLIGPVFVSTLYTSSGPPMVWIMELGVIAFNLLLWVILYKRMVPLNMDNEDLINKECK